jgi:hypothetical protein
MKNGQLAFNFLMAAVLAVCIIISVPYIRANYDNPKTQYEVGLEYINLNTGYYELIRVDTVDKYPHTVYYSHDGIVIREYCKELNCKELNSK